MSTLVYNYQGASLYDDLDDLDDDDIDDAVENVGRLGAAITKRLTENVRGLGSVLEIPQMVFDSPRRAERSNRNAPVRNRDDLGEVLDIPEVF